VRERAEEEVRLADQRVAAARRAQEAEAELEVAREEAAAARQSAEAASVAVRARADALRPLLPVMLRLSLWPAETVLAVPAGQRDSRSEERRVGKESRSRGSPYH